MKLELECLRYDTMTYNMVHLIVPMWKLVLVPNAHAFLSVYLSIYVFLIHPSIC